MKKNFIYTLASVALVVVGCAKNEIENPQPAGVTVIEVSAPESKAVIAEDGVTVNWQVGDKIKVNDKNSVGLTTDDITSPTSAKFTFNEVLEKPFYGMYNAAAGYQFKVGEDEEGGPHCRVNLDSPQTYVKGSFDAKVATYWGKSSTLAIPFEHAMAYIKVTPTAGTAPEAKIAYIMLSSRSGKETLSGRFHLYFNDGHMAPVAGHANNRTFVVMNGPAEGVELGNPFIIAVPVQEYAGGLLVRIVDTEGNYMDRNLKAFDAVAGNLYNVSTSFIPTGTAPAIATPCEVSSSTANFTWTLGKGAATDYAKAWTIELAKDADFNNVVVTREISAGNACWKSIQPKFCFGGLEQGTTYYFRVKSGEEGVWSEVVSATTTTFDLTVVTEYAQAGDVILAEDFHDSCEGGESVAKSAGYGTKESSLKKYTDAGATMNNASKWAPWDDATFGNWGWTRASGSATFYPNQGHIKLGRADDNSQMVTPALSAISGFADIEVEVTAAVYPDNADRANVKEFFIATVKGDFDANHTIAIKSLDLPGKVVVPMTDNAKWVTYKATLYGVAGDDHLVIGSNYEAGNTRLLVSDVKVTVKALSGNFAATACEVSSSTLCFTWGYAGATAAEDINHPYEIALYRDAACTDKVISHNITANNSIWASLKPKFCFSGLERSTTYYFKVRDTAAEVESSVISATTTAFSKVTMPTSAAKAGDVILAEDFADLNVDGEIVAMAAGYRPSDGKFYNKTSSFTIANNTVSYLPEAYKDWGFARRSGGANLYANSGHIKLGTGTAQSYLVTPQLSAIPNGKSATVEVTVTVAVYPDANNDLKNLTEAVVSAETGTMGATNLLTLTSTPLENSAKISLKLSKTAWNTYTVTLSNVTNANRIMVGGFNNAGNNRLLVNDVVVKIKDLK